MCTSPISPENWYFDRLIALGYYDGPTEGLLERADRVYAFRKVAFDPDTDMRVIKLSEVESEWFRRIVEALTIELEQPRWPVWVPRWQFSSDDARKRIEATVDTVYQSGKTVAVALCDDTLRTCAAVRAIDDDQAMEVTDWFAFMQAES